MAHRTVVIGAGVGGLAAAWSARRQGGEVTVVSRGPGASALAAGAIDDLPWDRLEAAAAVARVEPRGHDLDDDAAAFIAALGLWDVPREGSRLARLLTSAGRIRTARGRDRALLDLARVDEGRVLVARVDRAGYDADSLARALEAEPFARARRLRFQPFDVALLRYDGEHRVADADLAARHDDPARLAWLAERIREAVALARSPGEPPVTAVLVGPWLGLEAPRAEALSTAVGLPVGECLGGVGGAAGLRFEAARERLLEVSAVSSRHEWATSVRRVARGFEVTLGEEDERPLAADAVILAVGGMAGGGIVYNPPEVSAGPDLPARVHTPFELSVAAPVTLGTASGRIELASSTQGPDLDSVAWPSAGRPGLLEDVGVLCEGPVAGEGLLVAGEVVAGRPRTVLEAVRSGIAAGARARRST